MTARELNRKRYRVAESGDELTITIPARRMWVWMILLCVWMVVWVHAEAMFVWLLFWGTIPSGLGLVFFLFVFLGWTVAGLGALISLLWYVAGTEVISLGGTALSIEKRTLGLRKASRYGTADISSLRAPPDPTLSERYRGVLAFECGGRTVRFGFALSQEEARGILEAILGRSPQLAKAKEPPEQVPGPVPRGKGRAPAPAAALSKDMLIPGERRFCWVCGSWYEPEAKMCGKCGIDLDTGRRPSPKRNPWFVAIGVPLVPWFVLSYIAFCLAALINLAGSPEWLPVPWARPWDFVEGADGRVYVDVPMYARVLCYDREGRFVASYPHPFGAKGTRLAAGSNGLVYFRGVNKIHAMSGRWEAVWKVEEDWRTPGTWRMGEDGKPVFRPGEDYESRAPSRAVSPGELLYTESWGWRGRTEFLCTDGSVLRRKGNSLEKASADGRVVARYGSHWLYAPFVFPWPGFLPWFGFIVYVAWRYMKAEGIWAKRKRGSGGR